MPLNENYENNHQLVFEKDNKLITINIDQYKSEGFWLYFDQRGPRLGTYDQNLIKKIGK